MSKYTITITMQENEDGSVESTIEGYGENSPIPLTLKAQNVARSIPLLITTVSKSFTSATEMLNDILPDFLIDKGFDEDEVRERLYAAAKSQNGKSHITA